MPKLKSKKKKSHKNKKKDDQSKTLNENNSTTSNENTSTSTVPVTVVDIVIDENGKLEEGNKKGEDKVFKEINLNEDNSALETSEVNATTDSVKSNDNNISAVTTSTPASSKKKRFSFLRKKDRSLSTLDVDAENSSMDSSKNDVTVQRASSMSHFDREHKSKIPRFRTSKKKNNLSASCSNVESTSLVLNPGMDDWRMTGLLDTVDKSNSSTSLNTSKNLEKPESPSVSLVPSLTEKSEVKNSSKPEEIELQPTKEETELEVLESTPTTPEIKIEVDVKPEEVKPSDDFVEANIDFEYSAEIHDKPKPSEIVLESNTNENNPDAVPEGISSPTLKDASTDAELYELENDERIVSIRKLEDIVRESKISLPKEVILNDWLVLNVTQREIPSF